MAGKKIKDWQTTNFMWLQTTSELPTGFPLYCIIVSDDEGEIQFAKDNFFHEKDKVIVLPSDTDWEQIGVTVNLFNSRNLCRKNNFNGKINNGWHEVLAGKGTLCKFVYIYKG